MNPEAYPACDWCGACQHCPAHGEDCTCCPPGVHSMFDFCPGDCQDDLLESDR